MLENLTELLLPALLLLAGAAGIAKKQDVYGGMLTGAQDGLRLMLSLTPTLVLMLTAVTMLRESGFLRCSRPFSRRSFACLASRRRSRRWYLSGLSAAARRWPSGQI